MKIKCCVYAPNDEHDNRAFDSEPRDRYTFKSTRGTWINLKCSTASADCFETVRKGVHLRIIRNKYHSSCEINDVLLSRFLLHIWQKNLPDFHMEIFSYQNSTKLANLFYVCFPPSSLSILWNAIFAILFAILAQ